MRIFAPSGRRSRDLTTIEIERLIARLEGMLADERFQDERAFFEAIRAAGIPDGSERFLCLAELWQMKKRPRGRLWK